MTDDARDTAVRPVRGRGASEQALINAAAELFIENGPNAVSVRAIAERAGVNHGLVHHYFGSKAGLVRATHEYLTRGCAEAVAEQGVAALRDERTRLATLNLIRSVLDHAMPEGLDPDFPVLQVLVDLGQGRLGLDSEEARIRACQIVSLVAGSLMLEEWFARAFDWDDQQIDAMRERLAPAVQKLALT